MGHTKQCRRKMLLLLLLSLSLNQKVYGSPVDSLATITVFAESRASSTQDYESPGLQEDEKDDDDDDDNEEASLEGSGQQTFDDKQPKADIISTICIIIGCFLGFVILLVIVILIIKYWMMPNAQGTYIVPRTYIVPECTEKQ